MSSRRKPSVAARIGVIALLVVSWPFLSVAREASEKLTKAEVAELVRPVAMYPDSLLQTMLAASTFPDQIVDASMQIKTKEDAAKIEKQSWDESVKVIATYPGVLETMSTKIDWTSRLGDAFLNQTDEVLLAIQDQRLAAVKEGELESDTRQKVTTEEVAGGVTVVQIEPTDPQVVYVPTTTYVEGDADADDDAASILAPLATFGLGMALGSAIEDDDDYHYGGWGGAGFWYDDAPVNQWMDNRRAVWEDYNDRAWDRQEFRQEQRSGRQDLRQDQIREGTWKPPTTEQRAQAQQKASERRATRQAGGQTLSSEQRAQAQQRASERRAGGTAVSSEQRAQAQQRASERRASGQPGAGAREEQRARAQKAAGERLGAGGSGLSADQRARFQQKASTRQGSASRGWSSASSSQSRSAFSGMDSKARVNQARSRGVSSRSMSSSRASFSGGGRSMGGARGGGRGGGGRGGRR